MKYILIDKETSQFYCKLSTGFAICIRYFNYAERFKNFNEIRNFLIDNEINKESVHIVQN